MTTSLVTGGAGFIGSNLTRKLLSLGHKVIVIDNLSTGFKKNLPKSENFVFYKKDINSNLSSIFKKDKIDYIFHLAAQTDVRESVKNPIFDCKVNILGSLNLIENCRKYGIKKFIYSSTGGAIYGEPKKIPVDEFYPVNPLSQYGVSKYAVEKYLNVYNQLYGFDYAILRYGNVFGPFQNPHGEAGVIAIFINKLFKKERPIVYDEGRPKRDYIFVDDVAEAIVRAIEPNKKGPYHVSTGTATSVFEVLDCIEKNLEINIAPILKPGRLGEINQIALDFSKAREELNWVPKFQLEDGIKKTIAWFKYEQQSNN